MSTTLRRKASQVNHWSTAMADDNLTHQLIRLLTGLAEREIQAGKEFTYQDGKLYADEVADLMLPSVMCIAQDLSERLGVGTFGFQFTLNMAERNALPLTMTSDGNSVARHFAEVSPFVVEVFDGELMDCRTDLSRLLETAARLVQPDFSLGKLNF
jgi:hypothetical protein